MLPEVCRFPSKGGRPSLRAAVDPPAACSKFLGCQTARMALLFAALLQRNIQALDLLIERGERNSEVL